MTPWGADVVEKVARGLAISRRYDPDLQWTAHAKDARAAILATIEALGEPSEAMRKAADSVELHLPNGLRGFPPPKFILSAMLSQARAEISEE